MLPIMTAPLKPLADMPPVSPPVAAPMMAPISKLLAKPPHDQFPSLPYWTI
ncbi:hypothetical protein [uncultured Chryseobacterium sp.]|uniref:hypothetical protein n=1 Tax=uncultured Chryseobacterium sp. TaxID=259322 RepID=UPI00260854B8|nr:hypothetical protein [uncultured Chryseobacterium sp.]